METGSRRADVKAAMTFILGGRADHGRPGPGPTRDRGKIMRSCAWVALICVNCTDGRRSP